MTWKGEGTGLPSAPDRNKDSKHLARALSLALVALVAMSCLAAIRIESASAQMPPISPPPFPWLDKLGITGPASQNTADRDPPQIEVLTTHLNQGKNIVIVKITDESYITSRQVKYVHEGKIAFSDLSRDHDNVYYALVNVDPPTSILEFDVVDAAQHRAMAVKEIPVGPPLDLLDYFNKAVKLVSSIVDEITGLLLKARG